MLRHAKLKKKKCRSEYHIHVSGDLISALKLMFSINIVNLNFICFVFHLQLCFGSVVL